MKIFKILLISIFIGSCQGNMNFNDKTDELKSNFESSTFRINLDSLPISKLPIGNINLFKSEFINEDSVFFTNIQDGKPYEPFFNFVKNDIDDKDAINSSYKYSSKYVFDLHFLHYNDCKREDEYLKFIGRIQDINGNKILFFKRKDIIEDEIAISNIIDLVVVDKSGKKIDEVNISSTYTKSKIESGDAAFRYYKKFLIDNDLIKIKYIKTSGEEIESEFFYEIIYKISNLGNIVRLFDKIDGQFSTVFESGQLKNHLKQGVWIESYGVPNGNDGFNITNTGMYVLIKYVNGVAVSGESEKSNLKFYVGNKSDTDQNLLFEINPNSKDIVLCNSPR